MDEYIDIFEMNKFNILLIGAGQLGSRHLQGLAKSELPLNVYLIERNSVNLDKALQRFKEIKQNPLVKVREAVASIDQLSQNFFDLTIIATNADVREKVTLQLLKTHQVKYIIFEKVAFQSEEQFENIIALLKKKEVKSWVNCPRRFFPFYQSLRKELKGQTGLQLEINGTDWGLACNSVHFIDLIAFLSGDITFVPDLIDLEDKVFESKRPGYLEFFGTISGKSANGHSFIFECLKKEQPNMATDLQIRLHKGSQYILINESQGNANYFVNDDKSPFKTLPLDMIFQSGLTHIQAKQILETGDSYLPSIEESFEIHKPLLRMLKHHYSKVTGKKIQNLHIT